MAHMLPPAADPASVSKAASGDTFAPSLPLLESPGDPSDLVQVLWSLGRVALNFQQLLLVLLPQSGQRCPADVDAPLLLLETLQLG